MHINIVAVNHVKLDYGVDFNCFRLKKVAKSMCAAVCFR